MIKSTLFNIFCTCSHGGRLRKARFAVIFWVVLFGTLIDRALLPFHTSPIQTAPCLTTNYSTCVAYSFFSISLIPEYEGRLWSSLTCMSWAQRILYFLGVRPSVCHFDIVNYDVAHALALLISPVLVCASFQQVNTKPRLKNYVFDLPDRCRLPASVNAALFFPHKVLKRKTLYLPGAPRMLRAALISSR